MLRSKAVSVRTNVATAVCVELEALGVRVLIPVCTGTSDTGLNLPHYPQHIRKITTVDPNPGMNKKLQRLIEETGIEVDS